MPVLYAAKSAAASDLYLVDPGTLAVVSVGAIGFAVTGLAYDAVNGVLYGSTSLNELVDPGSLISIDVATGAGTLIGQFPVLNHPLGGHFTFADISCDSAGDLYGACPKSPGELWLIDKATGGATKVGNTGIGIGSGWGTDFRHADDVLFTMPKKANGSLYTLNISTAAATAVATMDGSATALNAASFSATDVLHAILNTSPSTLVTIDPVSGHVVSLGSLGTNDYDALAWAPTPAPPLTAAFTAAPRHGTAPLTVAFTDQSTGGVTGWLWTFGDGDTSTLQNPVHTYEAGGSFDVELTVT